MNLDVGIKRLMVLFVFILPWLAGCWDSNDLESRANVLALAIDEPTAKDLEEGEDEISHLQEGIFAPPEEDMIRVTAQVAVPGEISLGPPQGGANEAEPVWSLNVLAHSLEDAISNLQQEIAEELFLGQLRVVVINEDVAKNGVDGFNESLRRNAEIRRNAWMVVSQDEASPFMDVSPQLEQVPTLYLSDMVENAVDEGTFPDDFLGLFWRMISSKGQDGYLPYLTLKTNEHFQLSGLAYFKGDQMLDTIEPAEIGTFMGIIGFDPGGYQFYSSIPDTDTPVLLDTIGRETNINTTINDGKPCVSLDIRYDLLIQELTEGSGNLQDPQVIERLEKQTRKENIEGAEQLIADMQEEKSDIFGFGEFIRAKHPGYWNEEIGTAERWRDVFQAMDVNVDVTTHIHRIGTQAT
ncbi:Ger(x)C family spore germination protein [Salicibibacter kimchii]|nr:Ger(x)C family spore germination protein [Salicibibacter kimchii]